MRQYINYEMIVCRGDVPINWDDPRQHAIPVLELAGLQVVHAMHAESLMVPAANTFPERDASDDAYMAVGSASAFVRDRIECQLRECNAEGRRLAKAQRPPLRSLREPALTPPALESDGARTSAIDRLNAGLVIRTSCDDSGQFKIHHEHGNDNLRPARATGLPHDRC
jgi:hypothetical protein